MERLGSTDSFGNAGGGDPELNLDFDFNKNSTSSSFSVSMNVSQLDDLDDDFNESQDPSGIVADGNNIFNVQNLLVHIFTFHDNIMYTKVLFSNGKLTVNNTIFCIRNM